MTKDTAPETPDRLDDPIAAQPGYDETETRIALSGHPIHAMSVAFPIALSFCLLGADLLYWWTGDPFWDPCDHRRHPACGIGDELGPQARWL